MIKFTKGCACAELVGGTWTKAKTTWKGRGPKRQRQETPETRERKPRWEAVRKIRWMSEVTCNQGATDSHEKNCLNLHFKCVQKF